MQIQEKSYANSRKIVCKLRKNRMQIKEKSYAN